MLALAPHLAQVGALPVLETGAVRLGPGKQARYAR
jgi:hypothetical protein